MEEDESGEGNDYHKFSPKPKTPDDSVNSEVSNDRYISLRSAAQAINSVLFLTGQHQRASTSTHYTVAPSVKVHSHSSWGMPTNGHRIMAEKQQPV